jgi:MSHA biogenesis protein MshN
VSLINKMLKDLEARQSGTQRPDPQSLYKGLRSTGHPPVRRRLLVASVLGGAVLAGVGAWLGWQRLNIQPPEASVPTTTTEAATVPAVVTPPVRPATVNPRKAVAASRPTRPVVTPTPNSDPAGTAIEFSNRTMTKEDQAENKYREGVQLIRQSRAEDAEQRLRAALALNPAHVLARESLVALLVEQGRWLEAQVSLEEGLSILPNQISFGFLLARLYVEQGNDSAALQLLERLQPQAGGNPDFLAFVATLYQRAGRHADAVNYFKQVTSVRPVEGRWWVGLGISLEAVDDRDNARAAFQRANALPLDPRLAEYVATRLKHLSSR